MRDGNTPPASTGRAQTALVFSADAGAPAVISAVVARTATRRSRGRLRFVGPAVFSPKVIRHIRAVLLPVVDRIVAGLHLPPQNFELSLVNIGAASSFDVGMQVAGFSADVPVLLALLSAALQIPVPDDLVSTGHVSSPAGDIAVVKAIPAKLAAAVADKHTRHFVYPSLAADGSLKTLTPHERQHIEAALIDASEHLEMVAVADVAELFQAVFTDEAIALAGLRQGFLGVMPPVDSPADGIGRAIRFLLADNRARFWTALERRLLAGESPLARSLLEAWTRFHVQQRVYPQGFGSQLLLLWQSLPPAVRRLKIRQPLVTTQECIALSQLASESDHDDVRQLYAALSARSGKPIDQRDQGEAPSAEVASRDAAAALDAVLAELDPGHLAATIGAPIDLARATFTLGAVTVDDYDEFTGIVTAFYLHLLRHTRGTPASTDHDSAADGALKLVDEAFAKRGGWEGAYAEARDGGHGGVRLVLDAMTDQFKLEEQGGHVQCSLKKALDPQDWDARVAFMAALLDRIGPLLPAEIRNQSPKRLVRHYEPIVQAYVQSFEQFKSLLRTM